MKKIVAIGGGSGLATLLRGLKGYPFEISAIVTMTDDGASTGRLRREVGILPPGDIRKCLAALSDDESAILDLFNYRFKRGLGLSGHSLGNLFLAALSDMNGSFEKGIEEASKVLNIKGKVIPATLSDVHLGAEFEDGMRMMGQVKITQYGYGMRIKDVFLNKEAPTNPKAIKAIAEADYIVVGPGSLFTSVIPNFLHEELAKDFKKSSAKKIYVCNCSTERGETEKFKLSDHVNAIEKYAGPFDWVVANNKIFPAGSGDGFVTPVEVDGKEDRLIATDIADPENPLYHESKKLGETIFNITEGAHAES